MAKAVDTVYGLHAVGAVLSTRSSDVLECYIQAETRSSRVKAIAAEALQQQIACQTVSLKQLDKLAGQRRHQGVVVRVRRRERTHSFTQLIDELPQAPLLLLLDNIQDPHNLGACLRTAEAAGVHAVIIPGKKAASVTETVCRVACGAAERLPVITVPNLARAMRQLQDKGVWLVGTLPEATTSIFDAAWTGAVGLVVGAEGTGLRRLTREVCDQCISIPMAGQIGSLNVSVATGVCLFEAYRQRQN